MDKPKAVKFSLIRLVHKTNSGKLLEKKTLSFKALDIVINSNTSTASSQQAAIIELSVPSNTPPSIFPDSGQKISISYVIQAELTMKGVKSAIKLKPAYMQEISIVIGTFRKGEPRENQFNSIEGSVVNVNSTLGYETYSSPFQAVTLDNDNSNISKTFPTKLYRQNTAGFDLREGSITSTSTSSARIRKHRSQQNYYTTISSIPTADSITPLTRLSTAITTTISNNNNDINLAKKKYFTVNNTTANGRLSGIPPLKDSSTTTTSSSFSSFTLPMTPISTYHMDMNDYLPSCLSSVNTLASTSPKRSTVIDYYINNTYSSSPLHQQPITPLESSVSTSSYADRSLTPLPALTTIKNSKSHTQKRQGSKNFTSSKPATEALAGYYKDTKKEKELPLLKKHPEHVQQQGLKVSSASIILSSPNEIGPDDVMVSSDKENTSMKDTENKIAASMVTEIAEHHTEIGEKYSRNIDKTLPTLKLDQEKTLAITDSGQLRQHKGNCDEAFCNDNNLLNRKWNAHSNIF
ncbi:hypothetical protein BDF20DRAFT_840723 [Mycotypha africana]|uniref:uncharacterized protein n=1 Tax=Mycotypha africana TaxID=64632 RepID=UPI002301AE7F|nr:uncharacterized protein BDF20DRAFT_840723 [Mycotypha africana]KAI8990763.1 hypothetical protein BDF20DRAFT_840723 [Mycotypha africana]